MGGRSIRDNNRTTAQLHDAYTAVGHKTKSSSLTPTKIPCAKEKEKKRNSIKTTRAKVLRPSHQHSLRYLLLPPSPPFTANQNKRGGGRGGW
jgi:hypothetical protein